MYNNFWRWPANSKPTLYSQKKACITGEVKFHTFIFHIIHFWLVVDHFRLVLFSLQQKKLQFKGFYFYNARIMWSMIFRFKSKKKQNKITDFVSCKTTYECHWKTACHDVCPCPLCVNWQQNWRQFNLVKWFDKNHLMPYVTTMSHKLRAFKSPARHITIMMKHSGLHFSFKKKKQKASTACDLFFIFIMQRAYFKYEFNNRHLACQTTTENDRKLCRWDMYICVVLWVLRFHITEIHWKPI